MRQRLRNVLNTCRYDEVCISVGVYHSTEQGMRAIIVFFLLFPIAQSCMRAAILGMVHTKDFNRNLIQISLKEMQSATHRIKLISIKKLAS